MNQVPESKKRNKNNSFSTLLSHFILSGTFLKKKNYLFRCARSSLWHAGSSSPCLCTLAAARVPAGQAAALPSCSTFTGAGLLQAKKVLHLCAQGHSVMSNSTQPCRLWPARLLFQGGECSPGKNTGVYWPILVAIPF